MIADWLKNALEESRLSQAELARQLSHLLKRSIDKNAIYKTAAGSRTMLADEMLGIAKICKVQVPVLLEDDERPEHFDIEELYREISFELLRVGWIPTSEEIRAIANTVIPVISGYIRSKGFDGQDMKLVDVDRSVSGA